MSTLTSTQSATCSYCNDEHDLHASVEGSFCSSECFHRSKGEAALESLATDHTVCSTCYNVRKEIDRPSEQWIRDKPGTSRSIAASVFIGFEYPTQHLKRSDGLLYCECGAVEHHADHEFIKIVVLYETATNLYERLIELYERDRLAHRPDGVTLMQTLRETECDWALAVGRSIYDA